MKLGSWWSYRTALGAKAFDEVILAAEQIYEHQANAHGEAILAVKLNAHDKTVYECPANARDEATLTAKLNARGEMVYGCLTITHGEATLERV